MKKSIFSRVGAAAVVLTLVTASLVGGTFAKYTSTATGSAKATVAKWSVALKNGDTALSDKFELPIVNSNSKLVTTDNKVAPGATGSFGVKIDGTGSEVGYTYKVEATAVDMKSIPLKFYSDSAMNTEIDLSKVTADAPVVLATADVALANVGTAKDVTIYWKWDPASADSVDTGLGETPVDGTISISVTAEQLIAK